LDSKVCLSFDDLASQRRIKKGMDVAIQRRASRDNKRRLSRVAHALDVMQAAEDGFQKALPILEYSIANSGILEYSDSLFSLADITSHKQSKESLAAMYDPSMDERIPATPPATPDKGHIHFLTEFTPEPVSATKMCDDADCFDCGSFSRQSTEAPSLDNDDFMRQTTGDSEWSTCFDETAAVRCAGSKEEAQGLRTASKKQPIRSKGTASCPQLPKLQASLQHEEETVSSKSDETDKFSSSTATGGAGSDSSVTDPASPCLQSVCSSPGGAKIVELHSGMFSRAATDKVTVAPSRKDTFARPLSCGMLSRRTDENAIWKSSISSSSDLAANSDQRVKRASRVVADLFSWHSRAAKSVPT